MSVAQRWVLRRKESAEFLQAAPGLNLDPILARVLYARHIDTPERIAAFLAADDDLADPCLMAGMAQAVERLCAALQRGERIVVYGDFDTDGLCATVLLVEVLRYLGGQVKPYIPDRFSEAYGLNQPALDKLHAEGAQLVVSVDCGVRSVAEVAHAQAIGLDMIVTDHHTPLQELPPAIAVIDPKRPDCAYPFKHLAGVGVAYRLAEALLQAMPTAGRPSRAEVDLGQFLDLVALGSVADIAPLVGENRALVRRGLERMKGSPRPGLRALMEVSGISPTQVDSQAIGFRLGPRLNAAGRLQSAGLAHDLLATTSTEEAQRLSQALNELNQQRQQLLENQVAQARSLLGAALDQPIFIVDDPAFHEGIVGLVASRLAEEFCRPALVMRRGGETTRGSARSIEGFHITQALDACADLFLRHGGHARAAGFTLSTENLPALRQRLAVYGAAHLSPEMRNRRHVVDALVPLAEINDHTPAALAALEPCGEGNPDPALASQHVRLLALRSVGAEGRHLRLEVSEGVRSVAAIAFRQGHLASQFRPGDWVDIIYRPTLNAWQGQVSLQLVVEAMRKSAA